MSTKMENTMKCEYGCGQESQHQLKNGKWCCSQFSTQCPINKQKNSNGLKNVVQHIDYKKRYEKLPLEIKNKMKWNKGKILVKTIFEYNGRGNHKEILMQERGHKCESCNRKTWLGQRITLELEHVDGDSKNHIKSNLKLLCPNCHSQTPTWRRRKSNSKDRSYTDEQMIDAIKSSSSMSETLEKLNMAWGSYITILQVMKQHNIDISIWAK